MASSPSSTEATPPLLPVENPIPVSHSHAPPTLSDTDDEDIESFIKNVLVDHDDDVYENETSIVPETTPAITPETVPTAPEAMVTCEASTSRRPHDLPDGWEIQEKERESGRSAGHKDKYYIQPGTGRKFRSMMEVRRFLATGSAKKPKAHKASSSSRHEVRDNVDGEPVDEYYSGSVTWVIGPPGNDMEAVPAVPYVDGVEVPLDVLEAWEEEFHQKMISGQRPLPRPKPDDGTS